MEKNIILKDFLRELLTDLENEDLTEEQLKNIGEFLMEYKYKIESYSDKDITKFLFLGFYITHICNPQ